MRSQAIVTVLTAADLRSTGERSLPRAIGKAAGVWIQESDLGGGSPILNGQIGNRILIVVDGVRLNDSTTPSGPSSSLDGIDPSTVERVEIVRGPMSVLYGSGALGGAILVWTKRRDPLGKGASGGRSLEAGIDFQGDTAARGGRASVSLSDAWERWSWLGIATRQDWGDLRTGDGEEVPTAYDGDAFFGSVDVAQDGKHDVRLVARRTRDFDVPRTDLLTAGFGQTQPDDQVARYALRDRAGYLLAYTDREQGLLAEQMQVRLWVNRYREQREERPTGSPLLGFENDLTETVGIGADWRGLFFEHHLITWGFDAAEDQVDSSRSELDLSNGQVTPQQGAFAPDSRSTSAGVFVQDEMTSFAPWDVTAGVRYSIHDYAFDRFLSQGSGSEERNFGAWTGSLSMGRELLDGVRVTGSVAQAFRAPDLQELANDGTFAGGVEVANPDLDPERDVTAQLALDVRRDAWSGWIGAWWSEIDDLIGRRLLDAGDPATAGDEIYRRDNVGRGRIYGVDAGLRRRLGEEGTPWSFDLLASWIRGRLFDRTLDPSTGTAPLDDVPFQRIPPLHGELGLDWTAPARRWLDRARLSLVWAAEQDQLHPADVADPSIDPAGTDGWVRLDLDVGGPLGRTFGWQREGSRWTLGVHNLLDESYRVHGSGLDAPGIGLVFGLHVSL